MDPSVGRVSDRRLRGCSSLRRARVLGGLCYRPASGASIDAGHSTDGNNSHDNDADHQGSPSDPPADRRFLLSSS